MPDAKKTPSFHPDVGSQELTDEIIRARAYQLFEKRGCQHGHDMEDWLEAEAEIMGRKPNAITDEPTLVERAASKAA